MKKNLTITFTLLLAFTSGAFSQDQHFSQFFASPMTLNPALAGAFNGKYRMSFIYRDQWRSVLDNPFRTFSAAVDFRFGMKWRGRNTKDRVGAGVLFYNDRVGATNFTTNQINVLLAYHKYLSDDQFLTLGFQGGLSQRSINYEGASFGDQFNGSDGYTDPTAEVLPENNFGFADFGVGLNYSYAPDNSTAIYAGAAIHHLLEPQMSFFASREENEGSPLEIRDSKLFRKYTAHFAMSLPLGKGVRIDPRFLGYLQGPHMALIGGANFRFLLNEINGVALHTGGWVRWARPADESAEQTVDFDAGVAMVGFEYNNFLLGFSYDFTFDQLNLNQRNQGALEISIAYLGQYINETVLCPKF